MGEIWSFTPLMVCLRRTIWSRLKQTKLLEKRIHAVSAASCLGQWPERPETKTGKSRKSSDSSATTSSLHHFYLGAVFKDFSNSCSGLFFPLMLASPPLHVHSYRKEHQRSFASEPSLCFFITKYMQQSFYHGLLHFEIWIHIYSATLWNRWSRFRVNGSFNLPVFQKNWTTTKLLAYISTCSTFLNISFC